MNQIKKKIIKLINITKEIITEITKRTPKEEQEEEEEEEEEMKSMWLICSLLLLGYSLYSEFLSEMN